MPQVALPGIEVEARASAGFEREFQFVEPGERGLAGGEIGWLVAEGRVYPNFVIGKVVGGMLLIDGDPLLVIAESCRCGGAED
ncbi:MAG TPA: hypothetical protein VLO11_13355, partial [Luteolibacter sp.]|nr:hypothetical protein [Luteolibacter sp.]